MLKKLKKWDISTPYLVKIWDWPKIYKTKSLFTILILKLTYLIKKNLIKITLVNTTSMSTWRKYWLSQAVFFNWEIRELKKQQNFLLFVVLLIMEPIQSRMEHFLKSKVKVSQTIFKYIEKWFKIRILRGTTY